MSSIPVHWFEVLKLCVQFGGALVIARLTVRWALKRFQSEKAWERRMQAYLDAMHAINQMEALVSTWLDRAYENRDVSEDFQQSESTTFQEAKRRLIDGVVAARICFHKELQNSLKNSKVV